ncbi:MAG: phenylalanine--tRNA ligase subunit beta [Pontiellaceae bacterium]
MKVPVSWLNELVKVDADLEGLSDRLTFAGLEVEAIETVGSDFAGVVAGRVVEVEPHPNADTLQLCMVDYGTNEPMRVVCGAPNVVVDGVYPFAPVGTTLPAGFTLKKAKIRGEVSLGMLCAKDELGLGADHSGLLELDADVVAGTPFAEIWGAPETVIELEITPNRPDCLSMVGVARELAVLSDQPVRLPEFKLPECVDADCAVEVCDAVAVPRYSVRTIEGVKVAPSPKWIQDRLEAVGIRPINNVVDVTNYVMLETGHPLHAFDRRAITGNQIQVRWAEVDEKLITLDGIERKLSADMLVIADDEKALALAGVMGGANSEVVDDTTTVVLEAACFEASTIRATAKDLGLHSDASYRFQRGVCADSVAAASERAAMLLMELAGAASCSAPADAYAAPFVSMEIEVSWARIARRIGASITVEEMRYILTKLEMELREDDGVRAKVVPPAFRLDMGREIDVVEEVARIYGMDRIPELPPVARVVADCSDTRTRLIRELRNGLQGLGVSEIMNYTLVSDALLDRFDKENQGVREELPHPISEDQSILRPSLIPQLVDSLGRNHARQVEEACFYELGRVFNRREDVVVQEERLSLGIMGPVGRGRLDKRAAVKAEESFLWMKGLVEQLLDLQGLKAVRFEAFEGTPFAVGQAVAIYHGECCIGSLGIMKAEIGASWRLHVPVAVAELSLEPLLAEAGRLDSVVEVPVYPSMSRDVALVVDENITHEAVMKLVDKANPKNLERTELFDVYTGKGMEKGKKSIAYNFVYRSSKQTLTDKKVNKVHQQVMDLLCRELPAEIRT